MKILSLYLEQFRTYPMLTLDLTGGDLHIFIGPNGVGKTNILESIGLLSLTKSFLSVEEYDLPTWDTSFYRVKGHMQIDGGERQMLEVVSMLTPRKKKAYFFNDVPFALSKIVGFLPTVIFLPQDLDLFTGTPANRRRFIDRLLCQVSSEYLAALLLYHKILRQRNALLKSLARGFGEASLLGVWDEKLVEQGVKITLARIELIEMLNLTFSGEIHALGESWSDPHIMYERPTKSRDADSLAHEFFSLLRESRARDMALNTTMVGPHREDWGIEVHGRNLSCFASRGQQRVSVLALILLQSSYLELRRGEKPVILLDDVFSELDDLHQKALLNAFEQHQVLITATHLPRGLAQGKVWEVGRGRVDAMSSKQIQNVSC